MLDEAGFPNAKICAPGDLDEYADSAILCMQGARIDTWGVGTQADHQRRLPRAGRRVQACAPSIVGRRVVPKIKMSENPAKITNPGVKKLLPHL